MRTSAPDRVYDHVKAAILDGTYPGGDLLTEGDLADAVGCSRTPVREGLLRLQSEGFVKLYPKKGALVVPVTAEEAANVWEARALVEGWAAPRAFERGAEIADELDALTERMREHFAAGDAAAFSEADRTFHEVIVAAAGNAVLTRLYRGLRERQVCINTRSMRASAARMEQAIDDHARFVALIRADDADAFVELTRQHLDRARHNISERSVA
ncbi:GntR family transcriptional regulator [Solicola gregarius]|uniref:GntR family transcriptional regulator n=1 Tax=Solicola gregarius TaxID=2908642 RepID=A0AA46YN04_9ACTN|nr:GntR family transcriptional regulator [Solicola gregarius]UYM07124.1 GntR family transcriptional regulator [Solicola gregarius]